MTAQLKACVEAGNAAVLSAVRVVRTIVANLLSAPDEEKYRRVRRSNRRIKCALDTHAAVVDLLDAVGFRAPVAEPDVLRCIRPDPDPALLWLARELLDAAVAGAAVADAPSNAQSDN